MKIRDMTDMADIKLKGSPPGLSWELRTRCVHGQMNLVLIKVYLILCIFSYESSPTGVRALESRAAHLKQHRKGGYANPWPAGADRPGEVAGKIYEKSI